MIISIIIPTYNPGEFLDECLSSVERQSFPHSNFEVLVVLNGDVPAFRDAVKSMISHHPTLTVSLLESEPPGVSGARNLAISKATGQYLAFVDDDDILSDNYLDVLYSHAAEDTVVNSNVYGFYNSIEEEVIDYMTYKGLTGNTLKDRRYWNNVCNKLLPRSAVIRARFDEKLKQGEDALVMFTLSRYLKRLCVAPEAVYYRRLRRNSLSRGKKNTGETICCKLRQCLGYIRAFLKAPFDYNFWLFASRFVAVIKHK